MKIKNIVAAGLAAVMSLFISGCNDLPTPEKMSGLSKAIGVAAGYACNIAGIKPEVKTEIFNVLDLVHKVTPAEGQSFVDAWSPRIDEEITKLINAGKLDATSAALAKVALKAACEGVDFVFVKYPDVKNVKELVSAAVDGLIAGFKSTAGAAAGATKPEMNEEAYNYIKAKIDAK